MGNVVSCSIKLCGYSTALNRGFMVKKSIFLIIALLAVGLTVVLAQDQAAARELEQLAKDFQAGKITLPEFQRRVAEIQSRNPSTAPGPVTPSGPPVSGSVHVSMSAGPGPDEFTLTLSRGQWAAGTGIFQYIGGSQIPTLAFFITPDTYTDYSGKTARPTFSYRRMGDTDKSKLVIKMALPIQPKQGTSLRVNVRFGSNEMMVSQYLMGYMDVTSMNPAPSTITYDKNQAAITITAEH